MPLMRCRRRGPVSAVALLLLGAALPLSAGTPHVPGFVIDHPLTGLGLLTGLAFAPDGTLFLIEKTGAVKVLPGGVGTVRTFTTIPVYTNSECGLLGLALDPGYTAYGQGGFVYVFTTVSATEQRIVRYRDSAGQATDRTEIKRDLPTLGDNHDGGCLRIGPDGKLFVSIGDGGANFAKAQDVTSLHGKILRLNLDGSNPADNPNLSAINANYRREIYAYGFRNPFRIAIRPTGPGPNDFQVFANDVGSGGTSRREEVNLVRPGKNHGWPEVEGFASPPNPAYVDPIHAYYDDGTCVIGGLFYRGSLFPAQYRGNYFYMDHDSSKLWRMVLAGDVMQSQTLFADVDGSVIDIVEAPDGSLYYSNKKGDVYRIRYVPSGNQNPVAVLQASPEAGSSPLEVTFDASGSTDADGTVTRFDWNFGDGRSLLNGPAETTYEYTADGDFTARVTVFDDRGGSATAQVAISVSSTNLPPVPEILSPLEGASFDAGATVGFSGRASDPEDGAVPGSRLRWDVLLHHNTHTHPHLTGATGATGQFSIPTAGIEENWSYQIILTATDTDGRQASVERFVDLNYFPLNLGTNPAGLRVTADGVSLVGPAVYQAVRGATVELGAPAPQSLASVSYDFDSWSDGGARTHQVVMAPGLTLTAVFERASSPSPGGPSWQVTGPQQGSNLGHSVRSAGDVNGDGYEDVILGAPDAGPVSQGGAYVYLGSPTGLSTSPAWSTLGAGSGHQYGLAVAGAGDLNGDGYGEVIVGANKFSNGQVNEGATYVYYGSPGGLSTSPGRVIEGNIAGALFGYSVAGGGDVNSDGLPDIIVGAYRYSNGQTDEGAAFAYHGSVSGLPAAASWTAQGNRANSRFGASLGPAGDVNGDGHDDVIIGAQLYANGQGSEGAAYVFHGSGSGLSTTYAWLSEGNQSNAWYGLSVATAGDVNGDGFDDVLVGSPLSNNPEVDEGRIHAFHGSAGGLSTTASWTYDTNQSGSFLGGGVASLGDVDLDGYGDVAGSAYQWTHGESSEGGAFGFLGSPSGLSSTPAWTVESNSAGAAFGYSLAAADVNGDGAKDLIVGAPLYSGAANEVGAAYAFHATSVGSPPVAVCRNVVKTANASCAAAVTPAEVDGGSSDPDQDPLTFSLSPPGPYGIGNTLVTLTVTDPQGAFDTCTATVTVVDGTPPAIACPANLTVTAGPNHTYSGPIGAATATDNCSGSITISSNAPSSFPEGITMVTWTARDAAGNPSTCQQRVTVNPYAPQSGPLPTSPSWTSSIQESQGNYGQSVSSAGDVNDDGYDDLVVGVYSADDNGTNRGKALVYHGSATGLPSLANRTILGGAAGVELGICVAAAGDVNGDGYDDIIAGAHRGSSGGINGGLAHVYHGSASGVPATPSWTGSCAVADARFGYTVSGAGDVNNDGYDDVIIGAWKYTNGQAEEGAVFIYHGSATGLRTTPNRTIEGNVANLQFGWAVSGAGDVNGDGYDDVIVGGRFFQNGQTNEGAAYVYRGSATGIGPAFAWRVESNQANAWMGSSVSRAGDVNGDGFDDVLVGARNFDNPETNEGRAYLYRGSSAGLSTTPSWTAESNQANASYSYALASAGDINADGYDDVIVGANMFSNGQTSEGKAYVYLGAAGGLPATASWTAESNFAGAQFGYTLSGAGDVNGDGAADVIVGAPEQNDLQTRGRAYVYYAFPPSP